MKLIKSTDMKSMAWKNGKGVTTEVVASPAGSSLGALDFDFRISKATISENGEFSAFPGFDRWLVVYDGAGLKVNGVTRSLLEPFSFSGEGVQRADLISGPVEDFGVVYRRGVVRCDMVVELFDEEESADRNLAPAEYFLFCAVGELRVEDLGGTLAGSSASSGQPIDMRSGDVLRIDSTERIAIKAIANSICVWVSCER